MWLAGSVAFGTRGEAIHYAVAEQSCSYQGGQEAKEERKGVGTRRAPQRPPRALCFSHQLTSISPLSYEVISRLVFKPALA